MNYRAIVHHLGMVLKLESIFLLIPLFVSLFFDEHRAVSSFLIVIALTLTCGLLTDIVKRDERAIQVRDGFALVAVCWICISIFGALPFFLSGAVPSLIDSLFESVSGFSTTGASILSDVEALPKGLLLWRSLTHWIGGMGVLVFLLAVSSGIAGETSVHVMRAESPGPAPGKLVPRLRQSSKILYCMYFALTIVQMIFLAAGGMPVFDSVCTALATAGTGGFAVTNQSIAAYGSLYIEIVTTVFMVLFGINFNMYYFLLVKNLRSIYKNEELRVYLGIILVSILLITADLTARMFSFTQSLRLASFQVGSIITTTGFATADFARWPMFSQIILLLLALVGGCAGSTAGGIKVCRVILLLKEARRLLGRIAHPRSVAVVKLDGKAVDKTVLHGVNAYTITFFLLFTASLLLVSLENRDFATTVTAVVATISNAGPGLGMVSPAGNYGDFSVLSKLVLLLDMLIGRLEIYPILLLFTPRTWRRV